MGYIYLITNTINGMKYVGQTRCADIETRWKCHKSCSKYSIGRFLLNAYEKYGIDNFKFQIICICFDEDCDKYEIEYINKFNTLSPNGYNLKTGGSYYKHHPDTLKIMSEKIKAIWTPEHRINISNKIKEYHKNNKKIINDEYKKKIGEGVRNYWNGITKEEKDIIISKRKFNNRATKNRSKPIISNNRRKVCKYNMSGELLETYDSITEASNKHNISHSTIYRVCQNKPSCKTAAGFIWKYV